MKQLIIMLLIILLSTNLVYSKGSDEVTDIDIAKNLIEEKKYDDAIMLLTDYSLKNPESIYEIQKLLDDIRIKRIEINELTDDLITAIYDEEDFEKTKEITRLLNELNPNPDKLSKQFLRDAKDAAAIVINKKQFKKLMDEALDHLSRDEYNLALDKYLLCLDFHRDEFDLLLEEYESDSEDIKEVDLTVVNEDIPLNRYFTTLRNSSFTEVETLNTNTVNLKSYLTSLIAGVNRANSLIDNDVIDLTLLEDSLNVFKSIPDILEKYTTIINNLDSYNDLFSKLTVKGGKSNFITYSSLTLTGRAGETEGLFYIINSLYPKYIDSLLAKIESKIESDFSQALSYYNSGRDIEAQNTFNNIIITLTAMENTASLWKVFIKIDENFNIIGRDILTDKYSYFGDSRVGINVMNSYNKLTEYKRDVDIQANSSGLIELREYLVEQIDIIEKDNSYWNRENIEINKRQIMAYKKAPEWIDNIQMEYNSLKSNYINREINILNTLSKSSYVKVFGFDVSEIKEDSDVIGDIIETAALPIDEPSNIQVYFDVNNTDERTLSTFYPGVALTKLNEIENEYGEFIRGLENYLVLYQDEKDYIFLNESFNSRFQSVKNSLELANENRELLISYKTKAQDKIILSKESENRGVALYENALQAFEQENFIEARELIETGKSVSEVAVSYSRNSYVIDELIPLLYNLNNEIIQEEARIVIRDVRKLITLGKTQYLEGAYIPASDLFREAELKWSETNTESHPEIPYWLALIKDALAIESGRYLKVTDPLYNILAGYLSFAENYYRIGIKEVNKVNKLKSFAVADSYLDKVLEVKPLNERARLLQLQVLKSKDPEAFKIIFNNDFTKYRNNVIKSLENITNIDSTRVLTLLGTYEEIVIDAYRANPRLSGSRRRLLLERLYKPISSVGKSQAQVTREKASNDENRDTINDSYTRFKDLYKIAETEQKNIVLRMINLSEVALGFKRLPVDTSNIRESNSIFILAQRKLESTNQREVDVLNTILLDLQKALTLNPENEDIPVVIDDILVMLGEESNFQLAPAEDKLFRDAQKAFINGNYFEARDKIVNILKANSKNKNYPKLKELINRVEIKLKVEITI